MALDETMHEQECGNMSMRDGSETLSTARKEEKKKKNVLATDWMHWHEIHFALTFDNCFKSENHKALKCLLSLSLYVEKCTQEK